MKRVLVYSLIAAGFLTGVMAAQAAGQPRHRVLMDFGWKFTAGDPPDSARIIYAPAAATAQFDDSGWRDVDLPHDWSIAGPFVQDNPSGGSGGYAPLGIGWYRKTLRLPSEWDGKQVCLEFDGVFNAADVWVNGQAACHNSYGYIGFECNLTPWVGSQARGYPIRASEDVVIAVRADNTRQASRWYTGGGIYRHVWLNVTDPLHVAHWGTYVTTPEVSASRARVKIETTIRNDSEQDKSGTLVTRLLGPDGNAAGSEKSPLRIPALSEVAVSQFVNVSRPQLWDLESPRLYRAVSEVREGDRLADTYETPFGIRDFEYGVENGLTLNGKRVVVKGVNLHHDLGALGAAALEDGFEYRLKVLRETGVNAIRTAHNPHSPELLNLCDRMGFLVFDEIYDKWYGFQPDGTGWKDDLRAFILRDRNHPSIFIWSVGNEMQPHQTTHWGARIFRAMSELVHQLEPTRPVTAAMERTRTNGPENRSDWVPPAEMAHYMDVISMNYQTLHFERDHEYFPNKLLLSGEVTATHANLDPRDVRNPWFRTRDYSTNEYVPYVGGQFIWAGIDYLGEARWPSKGSNFNPISTTGFRKPTSYYVQSLYSDEPMIYIAVRQAGETPGAFFGGRVLSSHWNWPESEKTLAVQTYTNAESVELILNGKSMGEKKLVDFDNRIILWDVPNEPGMLRAVAKKSGAAVATHELQTAGKPVRLLLDPDRGRLEADGQDLAHVRVRAVDEKGVAVPGDRSLVHFEISGAGSIRGVDNGDTTDHTSFQAAQRENRDGRGLVIVQSARKPGRIRLVARADGLAEASVEIDVGPVNGPPTLP